jgi:hypothetical protein
LPDTNAKVFKAEKVSVLADLGLVVGKAIVCTESGEDHYDLQGDHIPKLVAVEAMLDFSKSRTHKVMHAGDPAGEFECFFPITAETCKACDLTADWEGIVVGFRPEPAVMAKFASGEFTGFSVGGSCSYVEEAA